MEQEDSRPVPAQPDQIERILAGIRDQFLVLDREWRYVHFNERVPEATGRRREEILGQSVWEVFPDLRGTVFEREVRRAAAEGVITRFEYFHSPWNRWFENHVYPVPEGVSIFVTEVTDRKRAEQALRESNERFRLLAEAMPQMVWTAAPDGTITFINHQWTAYTGLTLEQTRQLDLVESVFHPADLEVATRRWSHSLATGEPHEVQWRFKRSSDGAYRWFLTRALPVRDEEGRIREWFGTATDIDDQKRMEEALRQTEERFRFTARATGVTLFQQDTDLRYLWLANPITGYSLEGIIGLTDEEISHSVEDLPALIRAKRWVLEAGRGTRIEVVNNPPRSPREVHEVTLEPMRDAAGRITGLMGTGIDITQRKRAEEELREAGRRKDEFLATLAHELRNPLAPLRSGLQILRLAMDDPGAAERAYGMMERQLGRMVRLIDDLLDVGRISQGKLELRRERTELAAVVRNAVETTRPLIEERRHELAVRLPSGPVFLDGDVTRLEQVFSNLLNNAAKFTAPGGRIEIVAEPRGERVAVSVRDNGDGIPADMLPRIFEMFTQGDRSLERAQGGLGIGLTLARRLVEMHGGTIEARSGGPGQGSEMIVLLPTVPASAAAGTERVQAEPVAGAGLRVLVVDDNRDSAESLAMLLKILGHETRVAHDGLEGLDLAAEFRPNVVLLDIGMPKLNGYETCRRLRQQPYGEAAVLIALTGWGQEEDRRQSREAGFDHHLVKPVEPALLQSLLVGAPLTGRPGPRAGIVKLV